MEYLRQIEEDIRGLGSEAKKRYPEVKEATDRALITLKTMREMYVADKMRKSGDKVVKFPQSSDVSAPYILACNYADANPKLLLIALSGIQMLVNYEVVPPGDVKNILRVFSIQAAAGKPELQLKLLQILLQLANSLSQNARTSAYLTEATLSSFLSLALQLCDGRSSTLSVTSTAFATARQIIAIVMEGACGAFTNVADVDTTSDDDSPYTSISPDKITENFGSSAQNLLKDLACFIAGRSGELMRGMVVQPTVALDLLDDILVGWKSVFWSMPGFRNILQHEIYSSLKSLLKGLQDDFANSVLKNGVGPGATFTSKVVRLARSYLLYFSMPELMDEIDVIITLLIHSLQPDRTLALVERTGASFAEEATSMLAGSIISRLNIIPGLGSTKTASGLKNSSNVGLEGHYLILIKSQGQSSGSLSESHILAHPAGACIEALLSFFSSDLTALLALDKGSALVYSAITNTLVSVRAIIYGGLTSDSNAADFDATIRNSQLFVILEGLFTNNEITVDASIRVIHDYILTTQIISPMDLLLLSFEVLQAVVRLLGKLVLTILPREFDSFTELLHGWQETGLSVFLSRSAIYSVQVNREAVPRSTIIELVSNICTAVYQSVHETCDAVHLHSENQTIIRRNLGILAEVSIIAGICGTQTACELMISDICRMSVPDWHQHPMISVDQHVDAKRQYQWRHFQASVRLFQVVHVLADTITDWDVIVNAFDLIAHCLLATKLLMHDDVSATDVDKLSDAIGRFRQYTVYLSDDSLIKLMASLVATSLNSVSSVSDGIDTVWEKNKSRRMSNTAYLTEELSSGAVSLSLVAAIEVTKFNVFRISYVWQMVISHLRILASTNNEMVRAVAVAATNDLIATTLDYTKTGNFSSLPTVEHVGEFPLVSPFHVISDDFIFYRLVPHFDACLLGNAVHKLILPDRARRMVPTLSQSDLFSALKALSSVRQDDVSKEILEGLFKILQGDGELINGGGWSAIIDLLATVPAAMKPAPLGDDTTNGETQPKWPGASLATAFNCIKLVLDEFMDLVPSTNVVLVVLCLGSFAMQVQDVNISLTALEMLWKVYDQVMRDPKRDPGLAQSVFDVTMSNLSISSLDQRPEIRHCAMNTLFAALTMTANASLTSESQWKQVFEEVIFPLFQRAGDRSKQAAETNEVAIAPELKKGKKMTLHHSRDTAQKQWSETRVLALRGLARVIKTCTSILLQEPWYLSTWKFALEICAFASQAAQVDQEVALAGLDVIFTMVKVVSSGSTKSHSPAAVASSEAARATLWQLTWTSVVDCCKFESPSPEIALHICQNLACLYSTSGKEDFESSLVLRNLCESIVLVARPRMILREAGSDPRDGARASKVAVVQLQRAVLDLLRTISPSDIESLHCVISASVEVAFSSHCVEMISLTTGAVVLLECCGAKLRDDVIEYLVSMVLNEKVGSDGAISYMRIPGAHSVILEIVFGRFELDYCKPAMAIRSETVDFIGHEISNYTQDGLKIPVTSQKGNGVTGFFSSLGKILSNASRDDDHLSSSCRSQSGFSLHSLPIMSLAKENINTWTTFYSLPSELSVLVTTFETCSIRMSSNGCDDIPEELKKKVLVALHCIMGPWRVHELPSARDTFGSVISSDEDVSSKLLRFIDLVYARASLFKDSGWLVSLVNVLATNVRLQIHAIAKEAELVEFGGQAPKSLTCILDLWRRVAKIFAGAVSDYDDEMIRSRALSALLCISRDLAIGVLEEKFAVSSAIVDGCAIFLRTLLDLKCDPLVLPREGFSVSMKRPLEDELLTSWLTSFDTVSGQATSPAAHGSKSSGMKGGGISEKAHLLLFAPISYKLLTCPYAEIRDLASINTANVDLGALVVSYTELLDRADILEAENGRLRTEIHKLSSSQHLTF